MYRVYCLHIGSVNKSTTLQLQYFWKLSEFSNSQVCGTEAILSDLGLGSDSFYLINRHVREIPQGRSIRRIEVFKNQNVRKTQIEADISSTKQEEKDHTSYRGNKFRYQGEGRLPDRIPQAQAPKDKARTRGSCEEGARRKACCSESGTRICMHR